MGPLSIVITVKEGVGVKVLLRKRDKGDDEVVMMACYYSCITCGWLLKTSFDCSLGPPIHPNSKALASSRSALSYLSRRL